MWSISALNNFTPQCKHTKNIDMFAEKNGVHGGSNVDIAYHMPYVFINKPLFHFMSGHMMDDGRMIVEKRTK